MGDPIIAPAISKKLGFIHRKSKQKDFEFSRLKHNAELRFAV